MKEVRINVQGYEIVEEEKTVTINEAQKLLISGKYWNYKKAVNNFDNTATLYCRGVKCPYCEEISPLETLWHVNVMIDNESVENWALGQSSLFEENNSTLIVNDKEIPKRKFLCPGCEKTSTRTDAVNEFVLSKQRGKIKIKRKIGDVDDIFDMGWVDKLTLTAPFEYYESIVFNLYNGHTYAQLENDEKIVQIRDVTNCPGKLSGGVINQTIKMYDSVKRVLEEMFGLDKKLCFMTERAPVERLSFYARFLGYPKSFYDAIPFVPDSKKIYYGFEGMAKKLSRADRLPEIYNEMNMPKNKTVRRIVFENPGLMFYAYEIKTLNRIMDNVDYMRRILNAYNVYQILANMHCYPILSDFLTEAVTYSEKRTVVKLMLSDFDGFIKYAAMYMAMSEAARKTERAGKRWLSTRMELYRYDFNSVLPSVVRVMPDCDIPDCKIDGYSFTWLINTDDYEDAGRQMHNCLATVYSPVVAIKVNLMYVAAMEINTDEKKIVTALMSHNKTVKDNAPLCGAIKKWCERFGVEWCEYSEDEDYPF